MRPITIFYALVFLSSRMCEVLGIVPNPGLRASNTNNLIYTVCAFSISVQYYFFMYAQQLWWMSLLFAFLFFSFLKRPHQCFTWCISYNFKNSHRQCISVCFDNKSIMMTYKLAWFCFPSAGCVGRKQSTVKRIRFWFVIFWADTDVEQHTEPWLTPPMVRPAPCMTAVGRLFVCVNERCVGKCF